MHKLIVAVDFDGTLIDFVEPYYSTDFKLKPNAETVLDALSKQDVVFVLNTSRYSWMRLKAIRFIKKNKLPIKASLFNKKPVADLYIDDKNIYCDKIDWLEIQNEIVKKKEEKENVLCK